MRLGLTDLGRIGAFHATTLTSTDVDPELILASLPPPCPCTSIA
jgi:hypothetical protein